MRIRHFLRLSEGGCLNNCLCFHIPLFEASPCSLELIPPIWPLAGYVDFIMFNSSCTIIQSCDCRLQNCRQTTRPNGISMYYIDPSNIAAKDSIFQEAWPGLWFVMFTQPKTISIFSNKWYSTISISAALLTGK